MRTIESGKFVLIGTLLFLLATRPAEPEPPYELTLDRDRLKTFGTMVRIAGEEMVAVADSENIEEHLIAKSERIFDDFAKDADFIGPDFITKPLARKAVRPVVKTVIRYVDKKTRELSHEEHEDE